MEIVAAITCPFVIFGGDKEAPIDFGVDLKSHGTGHGAGEEESVKRFGLVEGWSAVRDG